MSEKPSLRSRSKEALKTKPAKTGRQAERGTTKGRPRGGRRRFRGGRSKFKDDRASFKLVLRLLPPNLTEEQFVQTVEGHLGKTFKEVDGVRSWYYVQGKYSSRHLQEPTYSRAYVVFENMDSLKQFGQNVSSLKFVDDRDTSAAATMKVSPYGKVPASKTNKDSNKKKNIEGTIEDDEFFKIFLKSMKSIEENKADYAFLDISLFKPIEKEVAKRKSLESAIERKTEMALVQLVGEDAKQKKNKNKKKQQQKPASAVTKKTKSHKKSKKQAVTESKKKPRPKHKKNASKTKRDDIETNPNVVILEAAGKRELQKRQRLQKKEEPSAKLKNNPPKKREKSASNKVPAKLEILRRNSP